MFITDRHDMTLAVKVALKYITTNQQLFIETRKKTLFSKLQWIVNR